jgi:hydroxyacylglutathione hydrolase
MSAPLQIQVVVSMPFEENSYIVWRTDSREALVIDPGLEPEQILERLDQNGLSVVGILNTHGHADHIAGNGAMKQAFPRAPLLIGANEAHMLVDAQANLSTAYGFDIVSPAADRTVVEGDRVALAGIDLEVREIPGHSAGHVVFVYHGTPVLVFGGDVLFRGSIGRADFPGGSFEQLEMGIRQKLYTLPDDTVVYPGHGPVTTTGHERRTNPFVAGSGPADFQEGRR